MPLRLQLQLQLQLLSLLLLPINDAPAQGRDPEGAAHGCAAFSDRGRMPSRKIPEQMTRRVSFVGKSFFFGSVSFVD
ncbi:hypothetical protein [Luteimonas deserti]|uniref:Uncharacterized protein n=1 Tax=Luteimonas deserti TaxID=2752306 RepID=A0A7Z0QQI8_9GAMM|nr:hypothetical protein [Luteimonas deserti]NYZ61890.1 hypothetical protein [Luteimonas deserti]